MSTLRFVVVFSVIFGLVFPVLGFDGIASSGEAGAAVAINQAEDVVASAYEAVLDAEQAGAYVSSLIVQLNDAAESLAKAHVEFRLGNFDDAVVSANHCSEIAESVKNGADDLWIDAYRLMVTDSWLSIAGSLVGVAVAAFCSFWGWRAFERRHYQRVLKMKPEVAKHES